jgi:hypothetical protein
MQQIDECKQVHQQVIDARTALERHRTEHLVDIQAALKRLGKEPTVEPDRSN